MNLYTYLEGELIIGKPTIKQYRKAIRKVYKECSSAPVHSCTFLDGMYKVAVYKRKIKKLKTPTSPS